MIKSFGAKMQASKAYELTRAVEHDTTATYHPPKEVCTGKNAIHDSRRIYIAKPIQRASLKFSGRVRALKA